MAQPEIPLSAESVTLPGQSSLKERATHRYWRAAYLFCGAITLLGLGVRATVADQWLFCSTVFYATPLPLLCVGCLAAACCTLVLGWRAQTCGWGVLLVTVLTLWGLADWKRQPQRTSDDTVTVLFWNVARKQDMVPAAQLINQVDADIVALVESGWANAERRKFWGEQCPEYDISLLGGGLLLLTKGTSGEAVAGELAKQSIYRRIDCHVRGHDFTCVVVDLKSDPYYSRQPVLAKLAADLEQFQDRNLIVLGDFNTPLDSVHFAPLRQQMRETFEVAGTGYAPTWPHPLPVLWLDQVWVNAGIEPLGCQRLTPVNSDHRPVLARLRVVERALEPDHVVQQIEPTQ